MAIELATPVDERVHRLHRFAGRVREVTAEHAEDPLWSMTVGEFVETLADLDAAGAQLQALSLGMVAFADRTDLAGETGHTTTPAMLRAVTRVSGPTANRLVKTARALEAHPITRAALVAGCIDLDQASEILQAVDALPAAVGAADRARAEVHLVAQAREHDARELKRLGKHLLDVIDPDGADQRLATALDAEERRAARKTFLSLRDNGDGTADVRGKIPTRHLGMLERYLAALLNPDRPDRLTRDGKTLEELRGEAFCQLLERLDPTCLPQLGGANATIIVLMPLETLLGAAVAAHLDTGQPLSPAEARRWAASAGVIPAVLGADGAVLDLGPRTRFHTKAQRHAMIAQQHGTCAVDGCDRPTWMCEAAHLIPHSEGGHTSLTDGALICPKHHRLADSPRYHIHTLRPGRITLIRRQ